MESISLSEIKQNTTMGIRSKGSSIFYSCTVLSVSEDKLFLSIPVFRDPSVEPMRKVEMRILNSEGKYEPTLYIGSVNEIYADSAEVKIISRQRFEERRKSIRVPCEIRLRYMESKNQEEAWYTTYSINMSPGGLKMYSSRFHQEGDTLLFQFYLSEGHASRSMLIRGRVLNIKRVTDVSHIQSLPKAQSYRKYILNICFEGLSGPEQNGIIRYIYSCIRG